MPVYEYEHTEGSCEQGMVFEVRQSLDDKPLSPADALSLRVMRWDCEIKKQGLQNPIATVASPMYDIPNIVLMPVAQIASFNLFFGQLASGSSIQPFATVTDYDNWLRRVDGYIAWLDTAIANMQIGMEQGVVWPKVLVERSIAQLDDIITDDIGEHLYFRPVLQMPATFSAADRERLTAAYTRFGPPQTPMRRNMGISMSSQNR